MQNIDTHLHYRMIDVSTIKELVSRLNIPIQPYQKKNNHRALDDILESIEELKHYAKYAFKLKENFAE